MGGGDVTDRSLTAGVCDGVDAVISALGVTRQKADPWDIDYRANLNILESARAHDVTRFCYVNAIHAESIRSQLTRAKTAFAQALIQSPLAHQVVSPSGYFSDMSAIAQMARRGRVYLLRPQGRLNPIHGADVAAYCLDKVESAQEGSYDIGGPEVLSWREVAQYAFEAVGRPVKITVIPPRLADGVVKGIGLIKPRVADTLSFMLWGLTHDCVGEPTGTHSLREFYREQTQNL
ncbi:NAD(P)H-binding protein [Rothia dentocariosa]|uniref:SDR family oxidoreductase n=1 Tax=Rothia dentocariosa TaxID=2047 RepID=UPI0028DB5FCD|nr:NAD(P)H-binding protein [Rothia dentocariosa]